MVARLLRSFRDDDEGATAIEYALIAGVVSIAIVAGLTNIGGALNSSLSDAGNKLDSQLAN
jgi:pilus assembly protein Flp/PilA